MITKFEKIKGQLTDILLVVTIAVSITNIIYTVEHSYTTKLRAIEYVNWEKV